jgi:hypothetical protein
MNAEELSQQTKIQDENKKLKESNKILMESIERHIDKEKIIRHENLKLKGIVHA